MRYILILFLILAARMSFSQKIDHSFLIGSWQCYNAAQHATTNPHPAEYLESYVSFYSDSTFGEEGLYLRYINTTGYYHIDKSNNILFKEQVERTRDEKTLSEMKEYMHHERPEQQIISLSKDTLILLEPPKDTLYYKRIR